MSSSSLNPNASEFIPSSKSISDVSYTEDEYGYATLTYEGKTITSIEPVHCCSWNKKKPHFKWQKNSEDTYIFYLYYYDGGYPYFVKNKETVLKLWADYKKVRAEKKKKQEAQKIAEEAEIKKKEQEEAKKKRIFPIKGSIAPTNPWKKI